jgi:hypothetical protein
MTTKGCTNGNYHESKVRAAPKISSPQDTGLIGVIAEYEDQKPALRVAGADYVFNAYSKTAAGFSGTSVN